MKPPAARGATRTVVEYPPAVEVARQPHVREASAVDVEIDLDELAARHLELAMHRISLVARGLGVPYSSGSRERSCPVPSRALFTPGYDRSRGCQVLVQPAPLRVNSSGSAAPDVEAPMNPIVTRWPGLITLFHARFDACWRPSATA